MESSEESQRKERHEGATVVGTWRPNHWNRKAPLGFASLGSCDPFFLLWLLVFGHGNYWRTCRGSRFEFAR